MDRDEAKKRWPKTPVESMVRPEPKGFSDEILRDLKTLFPTIRIDVIQELAKKNQSLRPRDIVRTIETYPRSAVAMGYLEKDMPLSPVEKITSRKVKSAPAKKADDSEDSGGYQNRVEPEPLDDDDYGLMDD